ncbi:MAG: AmmeMemoRadiSam system protein A [Lachnospiraceae bacterium]|nr:AmmeMemoRadiSam system protein A [Lachnospiraceae bacterium]
MSIVAGYIVPHPPIAVAEIGRGREREIQPTLDSFEKIAKDIARIRPDTIVLTSPHSILYRDYFHVSPGRAATGDFGGFGVSQVSITVSYDTEFSDAIDTICNQRSFPAGVLGEQDKTLDHGTLVPLYFIRKQYTDFSLVRIGLSGLPLQTHHAFGRILSEISEKLGRRTVFVASGDLAHCQKEDGPYGYRPEGPEYDKKLMNALESGDLEKLLTFDETLLDRSMECGHRSFCILAGALSDKLYQTKTYSHEATFGVGYGFASFHVEGAKKMNTHSTKDPYVELARNTIETYVKTKEIYEPPTRWDEMEQTRAGAFVSIHSHGMLRGCIGTFLPTQDTLTDEIIQNAISASTRDPRFAPISANELPFLDIHVDILSEPEPIDSENLLDAKRYGVIVAHGIKRGLLLPDLDGVDTPAQQIEICKQKAGIHPDETDLELFRFEVVRHV